MTNDESTNDHEVRMLNSKTNQPVSNPVECLSVSCSIEYFELRVWDFLRISDFELRILT